MIDQFPVKDLANSIFGKIVFGRPQTAGGDNQISAVHSFLQYVDNILIAVADGSNPPDIRANLG